MKEELSYFRKRLIVELVYYDIKLRIYFTALISAIWHKWMRLMFKINLRLSSFVKKEFKHADEAADFIKRIAGIVVFILILSSSSSNAQFVTWAFHTDLPFTQTENTALKSAWNYKYADKLNEIKKNREKTLEYLVFIEEVQRKIFNTLSNVDGALKDGKTMLAVSKKIPQIFVNLEKSVELAAGKPYLLTITGNMYQVFYQRCLNLSAFLKDVVLRSDEKLLIDPVRRHQFVYEVYSEINVLQQLNLSILNQYKMKTLQDAVDKVIPVSTFYNVDKIIVQDILRKVKF